MAAIVGRPVPVARRQHVAMLLLCRVLCHFCFCVFVADVLQHYCIFVVAIIMRLIFFTCVFFVALVGLLLFLLLLLLIHSNALPAHISGRHCICRLYALTRCCCHILFTHCYCFRCCCISFIVATANTITTTTAQATTITALVTLLVLLVIYTYIQYICTYVRACPHVRPSTYQSLGYSV